MHYSLVLVGAHDGSKTDELIDQACKLGRVLLIEPVPWLFSRLQKKYDGSDSVRLCNVAISTEDGEASFFAPTETANDVAPWGDQLGSLNPTHARQHDPAFVDKIASIRVGTLSFGSLISQYDITSIDKLITDTEGWDTKILTTFPFQDIRPGHIYFEYKHSDGVLHIGKNFAHLITMLEIIGYRMRIVDQENCVATLQGHARSEHGLETVTKDRVIRSYEVGEDGRLHQTSRPLICTVAYGSDAYFECLRLFLESIVEFGKYSGEIMIFSDRTMDDLLDYIPSSLRTRILVHPLADATYAARYQICESDLAKYSPILYLDIDIVTDRDLGPLLRAIEIGEGVCVSTEREMYGELCSTSISKVQDERRLGNWFGLSLLQADPDCADEMLPIANSGIIGVRDHATLKLVSDLILALYRHPRHQELARYFTDQPFLNYVLVKTGLGEYRSLRDACVFMGDDQPFPEERRGFVHFIWTRGSEKARRMKLYMDHLRTEASR